MSSHLVGLFIDFENLIYGLIDKYGEQGAYEAFKTSLMCDFAHQYGDACASYAYADWRIKAVNQWQVDLYGRGVELVHVLGRGGKNAVDIRMAIDLVESIYTQPQIDTYVVVSGDRDFLPVINTLKRAGKRVIALSTSRAMSKEMKRVCDETATYESLLHNDTQAQSQTRPKKNINDLLDEVLSIAKSFESTILTGAQLKQLLVHSHHGRFSEKDYGYVSFGSLMDQLALLSRQRSQKTSEAFPVLKLDRPLQGDLNIALHEPKNHTQTELPERLLDFQNAHELQLALSSLKGYQYMQNAQDRRQVLETLYQALCSSEGACWADALEKVCNAVGLSRSQASKYHAVLLQSQAFIQVDPDDEKPVKQRKMRLIESLNSAQALIKRYEQSILHKIISRRGEITIDLATQVLGLDLEQDHQYVEMLIQIASEEASI